LPTPDQEAAERFIGQLDRERAAFLELHQRVAAAHPEWLREHDARTNLLAKPVNIILIAVVNMRLTQRFLPYVDFWRSHISPAYDSPSAIDQPYFEQNTFYRFGFFIFLLSNIEHGFRAIQPRVVKGVDSHSQQPFEQVYKSLFDAVLPAAKATELTTLYDLLRTMRNTVHNNGVYSPRSQKDATYDVAGRVYEFRLNRRVEYFGWEFFIAWLDPIRRSLAEVVDAPAVTAITSISDIASHS
jgi:hypothetical protein